MKIKHLIMIPNPEQMEKSIELASKYECDFEYNDFYLPEILDDEKKKEWLRTSRILKYYGEEKISYEEAVTLNDIYIQGMKENVVSRPNVIEVIKYLYDKK